MNAFKDNQVISDVIDELPLSVAQVTFNFILKFLLK